MPTTEQKADYIRDRGWKFNRLNARGKRWVNVELWPATRYRDMSTSDAYTAQKKRERGEVKTS